MNCRISYQNLASEEKAATTYATQVSSGTLAHVFSCQYVSTVCCSQLPCGHWDSFRHIGVHAQSSVIHGDSCRNLLLSLDRSKPPRFLQLHCRVFCHTFSGCFVSKFCIVLRSIWATKVPSVTLSRLFCRTFSDRYLFHLRVIPRSAKATEINSVTIPRLLSHLLRLLHISF